MDAYEVKQGVNTPHVSCAVIAKVITKRRHLSLIRVAATLEVHHLAYLVVALTAILHSCRIRCFGTSTSPFLNYLWKTLMKTTKARDNDQCQLLHVTECQMLSQ